MNAGPSPTLGALAEQGIELALWCGNCGRHRQLHPALFIARWGPDMTVRDLGARMKCSRCGSRAVQSRPHYGGPGVVANHNQPENQ